MIAYLIKSGLCLALLLVTYHLFLEREKMHQFNRFYLLFALIFGLFVPLLTLNFGFEPSIPGTNFTQTEPSSLSTTSQALVVAEPIKEWSIQETLMILYGIGFFFFLIRFSSGIFSIFHRVKNSDSDLFGTSRLVLVPEKIVPHSFLKYTFVNKSEYESGAIEQEILAHELVHISQKHSLDVLFVEILKMVFWFNPVFYFYKKAIQLNHEFIADEQIARQTNTLSAYQKILLRHAHPNPQPQPQFVSSFNFSLTKKRFIMMNKKSSQTTMALKKTLLIPFLIIPIFLFSEQSNAQDSLKVADLYENDHSFDLKNLKIESHPEDEHMAVIKLFLKVDSPVLFQISNEEGTFTIVDKDLSAGSHNIHFDYSNIANADFRFTFSVGKDNVEIEGPFIEDGKLYITDNELNPSSPSKH